MIAKKKVNILDFHQVKFNYYTLKSAFNSDQTEPKITNLVFSIYESVHANDVNFQQIFDIEVATKTGKLPRELSISARKKWHKEFKFQKQSHNIWVANKQNLLYYNKIIFRLRNTPQAAINKLSYEKIICNGPIKKCSFFPICKQKFFHN